MQRWRIIGIVTLSLVLVGATACTGGDQENITQQQVEVVRGDLVVSVSGSGSVETSNDLKLTFGTGGRIKEINVEKGDSAKKGEVLAWLDTDDLELAVYESQVALTQAELAVTEAELAVTQEELEVTQAEVALETAEYNLKHITDTKDTLEIALLDAQIDLDTAVYNLEKSRDLYLWSDIQIAESAVDTAEDNLADAIERLYKNLPKINVDGDYPDIDDDFPKNEGYKNLQAQVTYAQARLDTAEDQLEALTSGFDVEEVAIKKRQVESAEKAVTEAQKDLDEVARKLADDINLKEHEVDSAKQSVEQSEKSAKLAEKSVKLEEGSAKLAEKSLNQDQKQLDKAVIAAPFDGVVASVDAEVGDTITTVNIIIHLIDTSNMELVVELDEIDIPGVRVNQDSVIELDALPEIEIMGKVTSIYPLPRMESGMVLYDVKVNFVATTDSGVKIGMSASIDIVINERNNVLMVPSRAITQDRGGTMVVEVIQNKQVEVITQDKEGNMVVKVVQEEQVEARPVITGISNDVETEIISGLQEGEVVLLKIKARSQSSELEFF